VIQDQLAGAIGALGAEPLRLGSGAGHDGQAMTKLCPIGMLFVRCKGGISHNPKEFSRIEDIALATRILAEAVQS